LLEHAAAYVLVHALRAQVAPLAPQLGRAQFDTLRLQLLKVAAIVSQSMRRLLVRLPTAFPLAGVFRQLATALAQLPVLSSAWPHLHHNKFSRFFAVVSVSAGSRPSPPPLKLGCGRVRASISSPIFP
jgi:DDE family transposase